VGVSFWLYPPPRPRPTGAVPLPLVG
jgi:hypothetical protein